MDGTVELRTADSFQLQGYPTIKLLKAPEAPEAETRAETPQGGKNKTVPSQTVFDYRGARTASGLLNWLERKTGPPCPVLTTKAQLDDLVALADVVVVGFFDDPAASSEDSKLFEAAAIEDETHRYVFGEGEELRAAYGVEAGRSSVLIRKTFDEGEVRLAKELTKESLEHFVWLEGRPVLFEFSSRTAEAIFGQMIHQHFLYLARKTDENHLQNMETVSPSIF